MGAEGLSPPTTCFENALSFRAKRGISLWSENNARFLAEFTLSRQSEILRFAQDDSEGLGMTGLFHGFWVPLAA